MKYNKSIQIHLCFHSICKYDFLSVCIEDWKIIKVRSLSISIQYRVYCKLNIIFFPVFKH